MPNKYMKKYSTFLAIEEMQVKTTLGNEREEQQALHPVQGRWCPNNVYTCK
jgi:hypothetical protein